MQLDLHEVLQSIHILLCVAQIAFRRHTRGELSRNNNNNNNNDNNNNNKICKIVDFAVTADYRIKLKECEKRDKYLDLARELKKLWKMKVTIIPIVIGAFGTLTKGLLKGLWRCPWCNGYRRRIWTR